MSENSKRKLRAALSYIKRFPEYNQLLVEAREEIFCGKPY